MNNKNMIKEKVYLNIADLTTIKNPLKSRLKLDKNNIINKRHTGESFVDNCYINLKNPKILENKVIRKLIKDVRVIYEPFKLNKLLEVKKC